MRFTFDAPRRNSEVLGRAILPVSCRRGPKRSVVYMCSGMRGGVARSEWYSASTPSSLHDALEVPDGEVELDTVPVEIVDRGLVDHDR